ncbi:multicopper oxidase family protein [Actinokineospora sp. 24-640]
MLNRRQMLALGVGTAAAGAGALPYLSGLGKGAATPGVGDPVKHSVRQFAVRMPVPNTARPISTSGGVDVYQLGIRPTTAELLPGVQTPIYSYDGSFVGPTIRATTGRPVRVTYRNSLDRVANVHLHGGHVPASSDGHPMDVIDPTGIREYRYPNTQQGATLWYHDHSHHNEAEHVYRGLHGFYLVNDPVEASLRLPSGQYDVPIMLRDALFDAAGNLVFGGNPADRDTILANGKVAPYFPVAARKYRFRLLNSATERVFRLSLGGYPMVQVGSDGGLLSAPVRRTELAISSGERVDIVIDFSRFPVGHQLVLQDASGPVLRFDVVTRAYDDSRIPDVLRPLPALPTPNVVREVTLGTDFSGGGEIPDGVVNGKVFDANRVDFTVRRGHSEVWNVTNADGEFGFIHNFHMHLVQFQVLDRNGNAPLPDDRGRKDTVLVPPGESVRVQATFNGDFLGRYVYHCHFLEHSAIGMMAQLEIVP